MSAIDAFRLTTYDCELLAPRLRLADRLDMKVRGLPAVAVLKAGMEGGPAWGLWWKQRQLIGAGGWTDEGAIWSLWTDLSVEQSKQVLRQTPHWARRIRQSAGSDKWLWNVYLQGNRQTEAFLRASHCVNIDKEHPIEHDGRVFIPFHLKTAEELARV